MGRAVAHQATCRRDPQFRPPSASPPHLNTRPSPAGSRLGTESTFSGTPRRGLLDVCRRLVPLNVDSSEGGEEGGPINVAEGQGRLGGRWTLVLAVAHEDSGIVEPNLHAGLARSRVRRFEPTTSARILSTHSDDSSCAAASSIRASEASRSRARLNAWSCMNCRSLTRVSFLSRSSTKSSPNTVDSYQATVGR